MLTLQETLSIHDSNFHEHSKIPIYFLSISKDVLTYNVRFYVSQLEYICSCILVYLHPISTATDWIHNNQ